MPDGTEQQFQTRDPREIRCRHCDARQSLAGYVDARVYLQVGDGVPRFDLTMETPPSEVALNCDICDREGEWRDMGYIYYPGITAAEKEDQREPWA